LSDGTTARATVLLVDDEPKIHRLVHQILEPEGFVVIDADDGQQALEMVESHQPDVVLLDVHMPRLDGMAACRRIRAVSEVPVVMVSAQGDDDAIARGLDFGADDYVTKPFGARELVARIRAVLRRAAAAE
jgi:two-component system response regulator ResD